ncbi:MAG: hypothetical protein Ta2E_12360 [Mycoplasmoidaceae bacterium]|nr:MAG: hypothetical protein Ta2E_12360 [Mycoplasmoidaceae bacterium]
MEKFYQEEWRDLSQEQSLKCFERELRQIEEGRRVQSTLRNAKKKKEKVKMK